MAAMPPSTSRHLWRTTSAHRTSGGTVFYQSCPCGRWRVVREQVRGAAAVLVEVRRTHGEPA